MISGDICKGSGVTFHVSTRTWHHDHCDVINGEDDGYSVYCIDSDGDDDDDEIFHVSAPS